MVESVDTTTTILILLHSSILHGTSSFLVNSSLRYDDA